MAAGAGRLAGIGKCAQLLSGCYHMHLDNGNEVWGSGVLEVGGSHAVVERGYLGEWCSVRSQ